MILDKMEEMEIFPSLTLYKNFLTDEQEQKLYNYIDNLQWDTKTLKRHIQQYGYSYVYNTKISFSTKLTKLNTLPLLDCLSELLYKFNIMSVLPNQQIINKYLPGEGIAGHSDALIFDKSISTLSLRSDIIMIFTNKETKEQKEVLLPRKSLLVLEDNSRYNWNHEIKPRKSDKINGKTVKRNTRISITFRRYKN